MPNRTASAACLTCQTEFDNLPVERDEDGVYAVLELYPCAECGTLLCGCCNQARCDSCDRTFCVEHLTTVEDGTPRPLFCCPDCIADAAQQELEFAGCCPKCQSDNVAIGAYYFGTDLQTGYQDEGEAVECRSCGHRGDPADLVAPVVRPARRPVVSETGSPASVPQTA